MKHKEIKTYREQQLKRQKGMCPLCNKRIPKGDAALDHCHTTGRVRKVLHKLCNSVEGRVLHWARRSGQPPHEFIRNLVEYWDDEYDSNPVHPSHRTLKQKEILGLKRRMRRVKRESTKQRYRDRIRELQETT